LLQWSSPDNLQVAGSRSIATMVSCLDAPLCAPDSIEESRVPPSSPSSILQRRKSKFPSMTLQVDTKVAQPPTCLDRHLQEQYAFMDIIGRGSSGSVWRAIRRSDNLEVALKRTFFQDASAQQIAKKEFELLNSISHPHIVKAIDFFIIDSFATVVLEFVHGVNLHTAVTSSLEGKFSEPIAARLGFTLLHCLAHLHRKGIVHRDIKPENIMVSSSYDNLKLCDFNVARYIEAGGLMTMTGTVLYAAPEVLLGEAPAQPADVWCAGVCLHFMLSGSLPQGRNKASNASTVAMRPITLVGSTWQKISQECRSVVMRALDLDDVQRPSAAELQQSAWFH